MNNSSPLYRKGFLLAEKENILISVHHRHVVRILSGAKQVELRRRPFRVLPGTYVWIYSTAPHAVVTAVATVSTVVCASPATLWRKCGSVAGLTRNEFDEYFLGAGVGCAIFLERIYELPRAVTLAALRKQATPFHPPQFFKRLHHGSCALDLLKKSFLGTSRPSQRSLAF
jgi:predicted transcriptional regulator